MKKKNGWILPDAMIGVAITVTALVAIIVLYTQVTSSTIAARDYQNATYIAQRQLENLRQYDNTGVIKNLSESITDPAAQTIDNVVFTVQIRSLREDITPSVTPSVTISETLDSKIVPYQVNVTWLDSKGSIQSLKAVNYYYSN